MRGLRARLHARFKQLSGTSSRPDVAAPSDGPPPAAPPMSRRQEAVLCVARVGANPQLEAALRAADRARDARDWLAALAGYVDALSRAPLHAGYTVQAGHCLKEMGRMADAELCYRDAVALGAAAEDVMEHLAFVAWRQGHVRPCYPPAIQRALDDDVLGDAGLGEAAFKLRLATSHDARLLLACLLDREDLSDGMVLTLLREAPCLDDLLARLILDDAFAQVNAAIIRLGGIRLTEQTRPL